MRHGKHQHTLVPTQEHRRALLSNLAAALFTHGRIQTTLAKAKGLRPFAEKVITLAKKAKSADKVRAVSLRRLAMNYVRDEDAISTLFTKRAEEFAKRTGGYTRIYKLGTRTNDAAEMALIELVSAGDEGRKPRSKRAVASKEAKPEKTQKAEKAEKASGSAKKE